VADASPRYLELGCEPNRLLQFGVRREGEIDLRSEPAQTLKQESRTLRKCEWGKTECI
jgi:hypothetical protein